MTTLRQQQANERNARMSTGPKTPEGKDVSRRNALAHGLTGQGLFLPEREAELVARRKEEWRRELPIDSTLKEFYFEQYVLSSVRIERCQTHETTLRDYEADRAETCWNADRDLDAARLGARLPKDPSMVLKELEVSRHGCCWLIDRWRELGDVFDRTGAWTDEQNERALDLLGVSPHVRAGLALANPPALVARHVARLETQIASGLADLDGDVQLAATFGMPVQEGKELKQVRRYEVSWSNRMKDALRHLQEPAGCPSAGLPSRPTPLPVEPKPECVPAPAPAPVPAPVPVPAPPPVNAEPITDPEYVAFLEEYRARLERDLDEMQARHGKSLNDEPDFEPAPGFQPAASKAGLGSVAMTPSSSIPLSAAAMPRRSEMNRRQRRAADRKASRTR